MDVNRNLCGFEKTASSNSSNLNSLETSQLQKKMVDLWANCKAVPSLIRIKKAEINKYISLAKDENHPFLEKISKKLQKLIDGVKEEGSLLQIPKRSFLLPFELHHDENYFNNCIENDLEKIAGLLNIPFSFPSHSSNASHTESNKNEVSSVNYISSSEESALFEAIKERINWKTNHIQGLLNKLKESDLTQYEAFYTFIEAVVQYALENNKIQREVVNKEFTLLNREFDDCFCEKDARALYYTDKDTLASVHTERMAHLHNILSIRGKKEKKIAIIGGGPAGLIRGLLSIYLGFEVKIIEKRNGSYSQKEGRPNFLHLGHGNFRDLYPLIYFGVFDRLILNEAITKSEFDEGFIVAICDLEKAMAEVLKELCPHALVTSVNNLEIKSHALEKTTLCYKEESFSADLVMLCDGAKSPIGKQLGLTHLILYKKMHAPIGFFSPEENPFFQAMHRMDGISSLAFESAKVLATSQSLEAVKKKIVCQGVLLRKKETDYVGIPLTAEEETHIKTLSKEEKEKLVSKKLKESHRKIDASLSFLLSNHSIRAASLTEHRLIPIQIKKAETPAFTMGKTLFLVRGDAHGTTHPASGYGAKTALSSLSAELQLLPFFEKGGINPILVEMFTRKAEESLFLSQFKGSMIMNTYLDDYEKPAFFIEKAMQYTVFPFPSDLDLSRISYYFYLQKERPLASEEKQSLNALKQDLFAWFIGSLCHSSSENETIKNFKKQNIFPAKLFQVNFSFYPFVTQEIIDAMNPFHQTTLNKGKVFHSLAREFASQTVSKALPIFFGLLGFIEKILER